MLYPAFVQPAPVPYSKSLVILSGTEIAFLLVDENRSSIHVKIWGKPSLNEALNRMNNGHKDEIFTIIGNNNIV